MATPHATDPTLLDPENIMSEDDKSEAVKSETLEAEGVKSEEDEGHNLGTTAPPIRPSLPIAVTSAHWRSTLESLLRFPGMVSNRTLFRPGSPVAEIAFALGATDAAYTITENDWVPIAERVFEIQTCCLMHARDVDFDIASDGWVTWDMTAEWCARVLRSLQGKGFTTTTCTAVVPFVLRVYLQTRSWVRFQLPRGRQRHKQIMDALRPDPSAEMVTRCSNVAKGFASVVSAKRKRKIELAQLQNAHGKLEVLPDNDGGGI